MKTEQTILGQVENRMATIESIIVAVVGRVACWLTPLPSAVLVARAAGRIFGLEGVWSIIMAASIELIGLVTSNLWLTAKDWNQTKRKSDPAANEKLALGLVIGYFVTAFAMLLGFEIPNVLETGSAIGLTSLLFPCLSAVGVIALNERVIHYRRIGAIAEKRAEQKTTRDRQKTGKKPARKTTKISAATQAATPTGYTMTGKTKDRAAVILAERPDISGAELGRQLGRSASLGRQLKRQLLPVMTGNNSDGDDNGSGEVLEA